GFPTHVAIPITRVLVVAHPKCSTGIGPTQRPPVPFPELSRFERLGSLDIQRVTYQLAAFGGEPDMDGCVSWGNPGDGDVSSLFQCLEGRACALIDKLFINECLFDRRVSRVGVGVLNPPPFFGWQVRPFTGRTPFLIAFLYLILMIDTP